MPFDLQPYRDALRDGGLSAVSRLPEIYDRIARVAPSEPREAGFHFEVLAFDAICTHQAGWALVCMGAAAEQYQIAGEEGNRRRGLAQAQQILEEEFPPYPELSELRKDLRQWLDCRAQAISDSGGELSGTRSAKDSHSKLHHRWWFRLYRTRQLKLSLESDAFFDGLGLNLGAQILLIAAAILCEHRPGGVPLKLMERLFEGSFVTSQQAIEAFRLDGHLHRNGLIQLLSEQGEMADFTEKVWLRPHPDISGLLLRGSAPDGLWPISEASEEPDANSTVDLWRMMLREVGLLEPHNLKAFSEKLPRDPQVVKRICEQLSVSVWTQGQPGQPVPEEWFRRALDSDDAP